MRKVILLSILAVGLFHGRPAFADANLCNSTPHTIWGAYGEIYFSDGSPYNESGWVDGWFQTEPGQCTTPLVGDVCFWWAWVWGNCPLALVVFADDAFGGHWGGSGGNAEPICTTDNAFFENAQIDIIRDPCPPGRILRDWYWWFDYGAPTDSVTITFTP